MLKYYIKSPAYKPSSFEISDVNSVSSTSGMGEIAACPHLILLTILLLSWLPPPLPPPVTLLACSLDAIPCMPTVVLYYCTFQGTIAVVQLLSRVRPFVTPWTAALQASLSITTSQSLLKTPVHRVGDAIQPSPPLSSPSPPAFNLSQHQGLFK